MASYETEHARDDDHQSRTAPRRPDFSSLHNLLSEITTDRPEIRSREGAVPVPADVSAAYRMMAEGFQGMLRDNEDADSDLLEGMISDLMSQAETPPTEVQGVDEEYISELERISIKKVKKEADCPICGNAFVDDPLPLLVRLPCHPSHVFDLECVRPWLLLKGTCPLDRSDLAKRQRDRKQRLLDEIKKNAAPDDNEEEWDGLYG